MTETYRTIETDVHHEIEKIMGSRFLGWAFPMQCEQALKERLEASRQDHPNACHHVFAYRTNPNGQHYRYSDDGEPSGTAGRPLLLQLENRDLTFAGIIVTRYFGGKKLGTGGLSRAYSQAALETLDRSKVHLFVPKRLIKVTYSYDMSSAIDAFVAGESANPISSDYGESVILVFEVPESEADAFESRLLERSSGRAIISHSHSR